MLPLSSQGGSQSYCWLSASKLTHRLLSQVYLSLHLYPHLIRSHSFCIHNNLLYLLLLFFIIPQLFSPGFFFSYNGIGGVFMFEIILKVVLLCILGFVILAGLAIIFGISLGIGWIMALLLNAFWHIPMWLGMSAITIIVAVSMIGPLVGWWEGKRPL